MCITSISDETPVHRDAHKRIPHIVHLGTYSSFRCKTWAYYQADSRINGLIASISTVGKSGVGWDDGHFSKWNVDRLLYFLEIFEINRDWESSDIVFFFHGTYKLTTFMHVSCNFIYTWKQRFYSLNASLQQCHKRTIFVPIIHWKYWASK